MQINFVYIGEKRFEEEGLKNHRKFYDYLEKNGIECLPKYSTKATKNPAEEFHNFSGSQQIWDFYNSIDEFGDDDIIVKMRTDTWIPESVYPNFLETLNNIQGCVFIGSDLRKTTLEHKRPYTLHWHSNTLPVGKNTEKTGDFIIVVKKSYIKSKEKIYDCLKENPTINGNVYWQNIRTVDSEYIWGQIYLIRDGVREWNDKEIAYNFARWYVNRDRKLGKSSWKIKCYDAMMYYKDQLANGLSSAS